MLRSISNCQRFNRLFSISSRLIHLRFSGKPFPNSVLDSSLTGRFNKFIIALNQTSPNAATTSIKDNSKETLIDALHQLRETATVRGAPPDLNRFLSKYDRQCCQQIDGLAHDDLLRLMVAWAATLPHHFHRLDSYAPATARLCATFDGCQQSASDFLTICHLLGASKKRSGAAPLLDAFLRQHFDRYADSMGPTELAIVATAAFRTAIRLQPHHGQRFERAILEMDVEATTGRLDFALLIVFVKTLRLARIASEPVARQLASWMLAGRLDGADHRLEFRGLAHLFVFFADNRFCHPPAAIEWLCERTSHAIRHDYDAFRGKRYPIDMRAKDFAMVLWCMAQLNVRPSADAQALQRICEILKEKIADGEYARDFDGLVDATLSLWQIGLRSRTLVAALFGPRSLLRVPQPETRRIKLETRKNLLLTCVQLERPDWMRGLTTAVRRSAAIVPLQPARDYLLGNARQLQHVGALLQAQLNDTLQISYVQAIRDLNIAGLVLHSGVDDGSMVFVEVCEQHTTLSDARTPFGLLALKVRLLRSQGHNVILINPTQQDDNEIIAVINESLLQRPETERCSTT